jgi:hypothetical protein
MMSAAFLAALLILISIPAVMASTPPYYSGPIQDYKYTEGVYMEWAQVGIYDYQNPPYDNPPWPCILHQTYAYVFGDWEFYIPHQMYYKGADATLTNLYEDYEYDSDGASRYCAVYAWPSSPYACAVQTKSNGLYRNTVTNEIINPTPEPNAYAVNFP